MLSLVLRTTDCCGIPFGVTGLQTSAGVAECDVRAVNRLAAYNDLAATIKHVVCFKLALYDLLVLKRDHCLS